MTFQYDERTRRLRELPTAEALAGEPDQVIRIRPEIITGFSLTP
jgi:hypothetical protein